MTSAPDQPPTTPVVGGFPEPDGSQPMSDAEFRMVRESLGLATEWLAEYLGVALRTVRRWEHGHNAVPDGVRTQMEALEQAAAEHVGRLVGQLADASDVVLSLPREDGDWPASWWRAVAYRVAAEVPGLYVRYSEDPG